MPEQLTTAYSGTTLENFKRCAIKTDSGLWLFDKDKEPKHYFKPVFFVLSLEGAIRYACQRAKELEHTPLAFSGDIPKKYEWNYELPEDMPFPLNQVWLPIRGINWRTIDTFTDEGVQSFYSLKPEDVLSK